MNENRNIYVCPETKEPLTCRVVRAKGTEVLRGSLERRDGVGYPIDGGVPVFVKPESLADAAREAQAYYEGVAAGYDDVANLSFRIQHVDEDAARKGFVSHLHLTPNSRVLELACGTGRDSVNIAAALGEGGEFYLQDISPSMLDKCRAKLAGVAVPVEFSVGNATALAFPDRYFDAVFSFGGLSVFGDIGQSLKEICRVAKVGAHVVVGDESMAPWLVDTHYGRVLLNNNPLFRAELPLRHMPVEAREVTIKWVVGGVYYLIDFTVGEGEPAADFDLEIPGARGGTLHTRYQGRLEGVSPEVRALAHAARQKKGVSMHRWLDDVVRRAAEEDLGPDRDG